MTGVQFVHQCLVTNLSAKPSGAPGEPPRTPGNAKVMGAPEVLGEKVSTPFAGHDLPGGVRRSRRFGSWSASQSPFRELECVAVAVSTVGVRRSRRFDSWSA